MNALIIHLILLIYMLVAPTHIAARDSNSEDANGKTFFSINPQYTTGCPEHLIFYHNRMLEREDGVWGSFQAVMFGGQTVSSEGLARYFMPFNQMCLVVAEGPNANSAFITPTPVVYSGGSDAFKKDAYDVLAQNFNIATENNDFESTICLDPKQSYIGVAFNYRQSISDIEDKGFWFDITAPVIHVKNDIGLSESFTHTFSPSLPGHPNNMKEALQQSAWKYGKISSCPLQKTHFSDIEIRIGYDTIREDIFSYGAFIGIICPSGNKPTGEFVFEPMVGRNGHWGIMWGSTITYEMWASETGSIHATLDANNYYMFEHGEIRSFDLKDKQWSRYINVFTSQDATEVTPGINTLTRCLKVRPKGTYQMNSALTFKHNKFECEGGMYLYIRQAEEVQLKQKWIEDPAIAGVLPFDGTNPAQSMSLANMNAWDYSLISQDVDFSKLAILAANNTPLYKPIQETDLNLGSASHPATIAHKFYVGIAGNWDNIEYPTFVGGGASYQWSSDNAAVSRWSVFGKIGVSV